MGAHTADVTTVIPEPDDWVIFRDNDRYYSGICRQAEPLVLECADGQLICDLAPAVIVGVVPQRQAERLTRRLAQKLAGSSQNWFHGRGGQRHSRAEVLDALEHSPVELPDDAGLRQMAYLAVCGQDPLPNWGLLRCALFGRQPT